MCCAVYQNNKKTIKANGIFIHFYDFVGNKKFDTTWRASAAREN